MSRHTWAVKTPTGLVKQSVGRTKSESISRYLTPLRILDGDHSTWNELRVDRDLQVVKVELVELEEAP